MQRWHLTVGLTTTALLAAVLAPRLHALTKPAPPPAQPPPPADLSFTPDLAPEGALQLDARLDRPALLAGTWSERFLTITLSADEGTGEIVRRPLNLGVVLDASGSMTAGGKMHAAKAAAKRLADSMGPEDTFSLVIFNDEATTVVPATRLDDPRSVHRAIDRIYEGGGTNLMDGLERAAREVRKGLASEAVGRIVLLSDGNANVGITDPELMGRRAASLASEGITVSAVGLGLDYNEDVLARISDLGGGSYTFVGEAPQLDAAFAETYRQSATVVARQTRVLLDLADNVELLEVIGWDSTRTADGWAVWMGDVYAGDRRKIVARVRVHGSSNGNADVASVRADYHDLNEGLMSRSHASATATVTTDAAAVASSVDVEAAEAATRAWASWHMEQSTRAFADGRKEDSKRLIAEGRKLLEAASRQLQAPSLAAEAEDLRQLGTIYDSYDPSSSEGQRAIKGGKEMFRGRAR